MAIVIGDIHGDLVMACAFLSYRPEEEHVSLGDLVDRRNPGINFEEELACLDLLLESKSVLLWGNHDLAYLENAPWSIENRDPIEDKVFRERYRQAFERFKASFATDGWLCTHAGISTALAKDLTMVGAPFDGGDAAVVAGWLNDEFYRLISSRRAMDRRHNLFWRNWARGGDDQYGGMFWYDPRWEPAHPPDPRVKQIFGHTKVEGPMKKRTWVNIHIEGGSGYWVFDTEVDDFALLRAVD
jgi:hypothetical protein